MKNVCQIPHKNNFGLYLIQLASTTTGFNVIYNNIIEYFTISVFYSVIQMKRNWKKEEKTRMKIKIHKSMRHQKKNLLIQNRPPNIRKHARQEQNKLLPIRWNSIIEPNQKIERDRDKWRCCHVYETSDGRFVMKKRANLSIN